MLLSTQEGWSQQRYTISGRIKDAGNGEDLVKATVAVGELPMAGTVSNGYGFYSLTLPEGDYTLTVRHLGYKPLLISISLHRNIAPDLLLTPAVYSMQEAVVTATRNNKLALGNQTLDVNRIKDIPVLLGEKDLMKTIQLLPGIAAAGEGSSGINVRGSNPGQNLIMIDEATVYNPSHLMGFFSVFNSDAIRDISLYKGNNPAEYGGRLASVADIKMNEGNDRNYRVSGGIGLIASRLNAEGPIVRKKGSFSLSFRRTYADLFKGLSTDTVVKKSQLYFYDFNAKANYRIDDKNRIYLSGYLGQDVLNLGKSFGVNWSNSTATLRWNHLFSEKLFSNTSFIFSNYNYNIAIDRNEDNHIVSRVRQFAFKQDYQLFDDVKSQLKFGFHSIWLRIVPGVISASSKIRPSALPNDQGWKNDIYISRQPYMSHAFTLEYGIRISTFAYMEKPHASEVTDIFHSGSPEKESAFYINPEPRITLAYTLPAQATVKLAYARNAQYLHLLSNSTAGDPTDLWIPSDSYVKPETADQISLGYFKDFSDDMYGFSAEAYFKLLHNQTDYKNSVELELAEDIEDQITFGKGRAYGLELYFKKRSGRLLGWVSYSLSRSERKFAGINGGRYFPAREDCTHNLSATGTYRISPRLSVSAAWIYHTGNAVTFPRGKYLIDNKTMYYYGDRNSDRMPAYHRLDLGATWQLAKRAGRESNLTFSLYNAYGRNNAFMITFRDSKNDPSRIEAVRTTLFRFVPSVTYNFKF
jgi:hypothetical protein